jgi:hypothetical protein
MKIVTDVGKVLTDYSKDKTHIDKLHPFTKKWDAQENNLSYFLALGETV